MLPPTRVGAMACAIDRGTDWVAPGAAACAVGAAEATRDRPNAVAQVMTSRRGRRSTCEAKGKANCAEADASLTFELVGEPFRGWTEDFQRFFIGLELDNSKSYFETNRGLYLDRVRGPMEALLAALEPEFGKGKVARANRDIRFSNDKSPYKTNIYAMNPGGYVALDARGLTSAAGRYELEKSQLDTYREAVIAEASGSRLLAIVHGLEATGYEVGGEELKRTPPGLSADHPRARLLRHKRLYVWKNFGLQPWLGTAAAKDRVVEVWRDAKPLSEWFDQVLE